ncbi:MAG: MBL fold metallo-hydrolase [Hamadaea sp.]|nr:MBL fold metallo-hydrolase [Hamadaea sp.]
MTPTGDHPVDTAAAPVAAPVAGSWDVVWDHGRRGEPALQVHAYNERTFVIRQSKRTSFEAPFVFLLLGDDRALLLDTGATADPELFPLRATVDRLVGQWLAAHPRDGYELVVAHTHGHGDHVAGDGQFADRPATTVINREPEAVRESFGFGDEWPRQTLSFDLGGRVLELIGSPGHHRAAVTFYDPWTGLLFTGDTVLPGRLYVEDRAAYLDTMERLVAFAATRPVTHVVGCHVEMTSRRGRDYPIGATYQPRERALQLTAAHLTEIRDAMLTRGRGVFRHDDFILYNEPRDWQVRRLLARGWLDRKLPWRRQA